MVKVVERKTDHTIGTPKATRFLNFFFLPSGGGASFILFSENRKYRFWTKKGTQILGHQPMAAPYFSPPPHPKNKSPGFCPKWDFSI